MEDYGKLIFKLWFKNGTYIEKEVVIDENTPKEDIDKFIDGLPKLNKTVSEAFRQDINAEVSINNLIVRCSELIAFDIIPIIEKESEEN